MVRRSSCALKGCQLIPGQGPYRFKSYQSTYRRQPMDVSFFLPSSLPLPLAFPSKHVLMVPFMITSHTFKRRIVKGKPRGQFCHTSLISESKNKKGETQVTGHERRQTPGCFIHFYYWFTISLILFLNACLGQKSKTAQTANNIRFSFSYSLGLQSKQIQGCLRAF